MAVSAVNHLDAFAGSGAFGLALRLVLGSRLRTVCYVERDSYAAAVLVARMEAAALDPAPVWDCIESFDGRPWRGLVEIVSAGYPCQPDSCAGKGLGRSDPRYVWPHLRRVIGEIGPAFVFLENVPRHLRRGFPEVHRSLVAMGYRVASGLFTAQEVGDTQIRKRLFALAGACCQRSRQRAIALLTGERRADLSGDETVAGTARRRCPQRESQHQHADSQFEAFAGGGREPVPVFPPTPADVVGWREVLRVRPNLEPSVCGMVDGMAHRLEQIRLGGNGIVPLQAAYAFLRLFADYL